jgi:hypothetical protein
LEFGSEVRCGGAGLNLEQTRERPLIDEPAPVGSAHGTEFDDIVGFEDEIEMVFNHDDRVALLHQ